MVLEALREAAQQHFGPESQTPSLQSPPTSTTTRETSLPLAYLRHCCQAVRLNRCLSMLSHPMHKHVLRP